MARDQVHGGPLKLTLNGPFCQVFALLFPPFCPGLFKGKNGGIFWMKEKKVIKFLKDNM